MNGVRQEDREFQIVGAAARKELQFMGHGVQCSSLKLSLSP